MSQQQPPEIRIREHLERRGGGTQVDLRRLLGTWGLTTLDAAERAEVADALRRAGITATPGLLGADPDETITLTLAPPVPDPAPPVVPASPPSPSSSSSSVSRARARTREDATAAGGEEPVEIPERLPRALLTFGAALLLLALFLPWFSAQRGGETIPDISSGWAWLSVLDVYLALVAALAVVLLVTEALGETGARAVAAAASVGVVAVVFRMLAPPDEVNGFLVDTSVRYGAVVALLALLGVVAGAGLRAASPSREGTVLPDGQAPAAPRT